MQGRLHEHDNLGSAHVIAQPRFVRRPKSTFSTASLGFIMATAETQMSLPPRWGDDPLSAFLQQAFRNSLATFVQKNPGFELLSRIDRSFLRIGENLVNPPDILGAVLLLRSHSAYRAACRLTVSGQVTDTFPQLRACLEYALYALRINQNGALAEAWLRRHDDDASHRTVRREFQHVTVMQTLEAVDPDLHRIIAALYERTIDFGAHPNERAVTGSMVMEREPGRVEIQQIYLHGDSLALDHAIKTTAQVGLGSLCVLQHIFRQRFEILGLRDVIDELRRVL